MKIDPPVYGKKTSIKKAPYRYICKLSIAKAHQAGMTRWRPQKNEKTQEFIEAGVYCGQAD